MVEKEMIKFSGSALYEFDNLPVIYNDREYSVSGVAELSYEGEATQIVSRNFMGNLSCEVEGFVDIYVEDTNGKTPDLVSEEFLNDIADTLAEVHTNKLVDACADDAMKWMKDDNA